MKSPESRLRQGTVRVVLYNRTRNAFNILLPVHNATKRAYIKILLDSGATENFISPEMAQRLEVPVYKLPVPVTLCTVDGSGHKEGKITQYAWIYIELGGHKRRQFFFVASLGEDRAILGYPFLYDFNPQIDWQQKRMTGGPPIVHISLPKYDNVERFKFQLKALKQMGRPGPDEAIYVRKTSVSQQWAHQFDNETKLTLETIPAKYRRHKQVFSEEASKRFPPKRSEDMTIKFHPGAPKCINCKVYFKGHQRSPPPSSSSTKENLPHPCG